ncbi:MAG: YIP1 family protein [Candidatus Asgardarchaeia archaeon]
MSITRCPKCGAPISPDDTICPVCGARLKVEFLERVIFFLRPVDKEKIKPLTILERIQHIFTYPGLVYQDYAMTYSISIPFLFLILNVLFDGLVFLALASLINGFWSTTGFLVFLIATVAIMATNFIMFLFAYVFYSTILFLILKVFTEKSRFSKTLGIMLISTAPYIIHKIFGLILIFLFPPAYSSIQLTLFPVLVSAYFQSNAFLIYDYSKYIFAIWQVLLLGVGIREIYDLQLTKSIFISAITIFIVYAVQSIAFI